MLDRYTAVESGASAGEALEVVGAPGTPELQRASSDWHACAMEHDDMEPCALDHFNAITKEQACMARLMSVDGDAPHITWQIQLSWAGLLCRSRRWTRSSAATSLLWTALCRNALSEGFNHYSVLRCD